MENTVIVRLVDENDMKQLKEVLVSVRDPKDTSCLSFNDYVKFHIEYGYAIAAEVDGKIIGFALGYVKPDIAYKLELSIEMIVVKPEYQRQNVGTLMIAAVEGLAKEKKIKRISVNVPCYIPAYELFTDLGYADACMDRRRLVKRINLSPFQNDN